MPRSDVIAALVVAAAGLSATPALAQDRLNYVTVFGGSSFGGDVSATGANAAGAPRQVDLEFGSSGVFDGSFVIGGAVGRTVASGGFGSVRIEAEISRHTNEVEDGSFNGGNQVFSGEQTLLAGFVNAAYDTPRFDGLFGTKFSLTAGGGVGVGNVDHEVRYVNAAGATLGLRDGSTEFAYQAFVGSDLFLTEAWSIYSDVRYVGVSDPEVERFNATTGAVDSQLTSEYGALVLTTGVRFRF